MPPSTPPPQLPPAGWYSDPEGAGLRWWDGNRWTDHIHADPASQHAAYATEQGNPGALSRRAPRWPWMVAAGIVVAVAVFAVSQRGSGNRESSSAGLVAASSQTSHNIPPVKPTTAPTRPERLSTGVAGDVYWVHEALADIHLACGGAREAEVAEAEMGVSGAGNGNLRRATEGAIDESVYGALVEEEDIDHLVRIYRAHPNAKYRGKPMKRVMLDAAADLGNGSCDQPGAERVQREIAFDSTP